MEIISRKEVKEAEKPKETSIEKSKSVIEARKEKLDANNRIDDDGTKKLNAYEERIEKTPNENGRWKGKRGESMFVSDAKEIGKQLKEHNVEGVDYKGGVPDFTPFTEHDSKRWGKFDGQVDLDKETWGKQATEQADEKLANKLGTNYKRIEEYRAESNLVWHKSTDGKNMQLISKDIHDTFSHSEKPKRDIEEKTAISDEKNEEKIQPELKSKDIEDSPVLITSTLRETDIKENQSKKNPDTDGIIREILDQNVETQKLPSDKIVDWSDRDKPGNSECTIKKEATLTIHDKANNIDHIYSGEEFNKNLMDKYGRCSVEYKNKEPDFSPFEQSFDKKDFTEFMKEKYGDKYEGKINNSAVGHVTVEKMPVDRGESFKMAEDSVAKELGVSNSDVADYMKSRDLTWHECGDRKTIRAIPSEINQAFKHTGGIGIEKDYRAFQEYINRVSDGKGFALQRESIVGRIDAEQLESAKKANKEEIKKIKQELF